MTVTVNAKQNNGSERPKLRKMMAQNAWMGTKNGSKRQKLKIEWWWLRMPKLRMTMDLTVETGNGDGSKRRNGWVMMATDEWWWLQTPRLEMSISLNADWEVMKALNADWEVMTALNAKTEKRWWLWTPKLKSDDGSERQTENSDDSERQNWK